MKWIHLFFGWPGTVSRGTYTVAGMALFALKYNVDRLVSLLAFDREWYVWDYLVQADQLALLEMPEADIRFLGTLLAISIPFIYIGTLLCVKRLRSAGLPGWLVAFFFVPPLNFLLFIVLSTLPEKQAGQLPTDRPTKTLHRWIPASKLGSAALSVGILSALGILLSLFAIQFLGEYGWGLFVGIPFFLGLGSVLLFAYHQPRSLAECLIVGLLATFLFGALVFILAVEGLFCIVMATPIGALIALIGSAIGYFIQKNRYENTQGALFLAILLSVPSLMAFESLGPDAPLLIEVRTQLEVAATPDQVWDILIAFPELGEPQEWLFRAGISYPVRARMDGHGVGAVRYCEFNNGAFVEPITVWDKPKLLAFDVVDQPEPMTELSPYQHLDLPHLHGYFQSKKGQFRLETLPNGNTLLEGTTWYSHRIWPNAYWRLWSDGIIHAIHFRVLDHIRQQAEKR